ncbi:hypothetical protein M758_3G190400 [Ceratodon purpureus]|nr:hypothetical protein M758_3G190400 [Ceratodon purpureus]
MRMEESARWIMESMWSDLPAGILENVFTFLPISSVCRFRTLSKNWNRFISSPAFRHAQLSKASPEEFVLITLRWGRLDGGWDVLDMAKRRFLTFSDDFLRNHVQQQGLAPLGHQFGRNYLAAAAGGLFCVRYLFDEETSGLFVCNPVLKTVKQLPHLAGWGEFSQRVVMSTDRVSMEYEIFVVNIPAYYTVGALSEPHSILVYESKTGNWKQAPYKPMSPPVNYPSYQVWWGSLTIFRNQQYCIVNKGSREGIVSYNKKTGEVSDLAGVDIPLAPTSHLVVCTDRLFCVIPVEDDTDDFPSVEIFEINIATKESNLLTVMPQDLLIWVLGHDLERGFFCEMESKIKVATGSADSILICTVVGRCAAYSLSKRSWSQYPDDHNLLEAYCQADMTREELYGSSYCLSLCPP